MNNSNKRILFFCTKLSLRKMKSVRGNDKPNAVQKCSRMDIGENPRSKRGVCMSNIQEVKEIIDKLK